MTSKLAATALALAYIAWAQDDKPVEQTYKNIQILRGVSTRHVMAAMSFMTASLGVDCRHCHTPNRMDADEKPAKQAARRMIQMTNTLNTESFGGKTEVNCYTCHRGVLQPATLPAIQAASVQKTAPPVTNATSPPAGEVFDRYVQALGGRDAMGKVATRIRAGVLEVAGMSVALEEYDKAPDKMLLAASFPNGKGYRGYDGAIGWEMGGSPGSLAREARGEDLDDLKVDAEFYPALSLAGHAEKSKPAGRDRVAGREMFLLRTDSDATLWFDVETGLLRRISKLIESPLGSVPSQIDFEDYRRVEGVNMPFRIVRSRPDASFTTRFDSVQVSAPIDDSKFAKPSRHD